MGLRGAAGGLMLLTTLVVAALAAGVGVFLLRDRLLDDEPEPVAAVDIPPFTVPAAAGDRMTTVPDFKIKVTASSALASDGTNTYVPENTIDSDPTTAWNSDAGDAAGVGQTLTYRFSEPISLRGLELVNGYAKSDDVFAANHRVRTLEVTTDATVQVVELADTPTSQGIVFDFGFTSKVALTVVAVYEGSGFQDPALTADLAISEVQFLTPAPE